MQQKILEGDEAAEREAVQDATQIAGEELSEEEAALLQEEIERKRAARRAHMDSIGTTLMGHLQEAVQFRAPFEGEWIDDIRQFEDGDVDGGRSAGPTKADTSEEEYRSVTDNITRPATITFAARLGDMIYPTNDRNWDIDQTPKPELPPEIVESIRKGPDGNGVPEEMVDELILAVARKRAAKMRTQIDDQLSESRYNDHGREVIMDACKIGHGVMKGPFAQATKRRRYEAGKGYKAVVEEIMTSPKTTRVDPWMVYPRPCRRIDDCPGVFELHEMSAKKVSELRIQPGFSSEQVGRLLKQAPVWDTLAQTQTALKMLDANTLLTRNDLYAVFEYNGEMPREAVLIFVDQLLAESKMSDEQSQQILAAIEESNALHLHCNVWMSQGIVMKVAISPIDHQYCLYKFFVFEEREAAPFGRGVPRLLRDPQRSVRMLWAAIMLNTIMSSSPQIGVIKGALVPNAPGSGTTDLRCTKPRVWAFGSDVEDITKAIQVFTIPSTAATTMPVYERAKQNGQEQVMLPLIAQGEPSQAVPTSSGLAMLMNASNIVQRRLAARYDASMTTPMIQGHYDWNMEYGDDGAKGDYRIIARASSHLLVKDIQAQNFMTALNLYSSNPLLQPRMKMDAWAEEGLKILDIETARFLMTEEEFEEKMAAEKPAPDPNMLKAEAAVKVADARAVEAQTDAKRSEGMLQLEAQDRAMDYEDSIADRESRERIAATNLQAALAGFDADAQARIMQMQADMAKEADRNATQTRVAGMKAAEGAIKLDFDREKMEREIEVESRNPNPGPRLA